MGAAKIGIIDDIDVARVRGGRASLADQPDQLGCRILHGADKDRQAARPLRDQRPVIGGVNPVRPVIRLGDHRRKGGAREAEVHFVADLLQSGLNDAEGDRIKAHDALPTETRILPSPSDMAVSCGAIRMVVSICSRIAGPVSRASSGSLSRA